MEANARTSTTEFNADPAVWGPSIWVTIHTLALKADADLDAGIGPFREFLNSLTFLLPCGQCRHDYSKWYSATGPPLTGHAFEWSFNLHNYVNSKLGKPVMSIEEARESWTQNSCTYSCTRGAPETKVGGVSLSLVALVVLLALAVYIYWARGPRVVITKIQTVKTDAGP